MLAKAWCTKARLSPRWMSVQFSHTGASSSPLLVSSTVRLMSAGKLPSSVSATTVMVSSAVRGWASDRTALVTFLVKVAVHAVVVFPSSASRVRVFSPLRICWNMAFSLRHCTVSSVPVATFSRTASSTPFTFSTMRIGSPSPSVTV